MIDIYNILNEDTALHINLYIDGAPLDSRAHTHPSHKLTNFSPPIHFTLHRSPLPPLHVVCLRFSPPPVYSQLLLLVAS